MKKLLLVLAVGAFVACNNGGGTETTADTAAKTPTDTTAAPVDTSAHHADTTAKPVDSTKK